MTVSPVWWAHDRLMLLDQRLLPTQELERAYTRWEDVADAIRTLVVRGAPAIGVAAAFGVALAARQSPATTFDAFLADLETAIKGLAATRPTAANLFWALERMKRRALESRGVPLDQVRTRLLAEAQAIRDEDIAANQAMGTLGADRTAPTGAPPKKIARSPPAVPPRPPRVPFYVAAPFSTIAPALPWGEHIPIEERDPAEVRRVGGQQTAPAESPVFNPAFDVTPAALITAIITERGVFRPPYHFS